MKLTKDSVITIGALGEKLFRKGYYIYTGSSMKNLKQRVERHKRKQKKMHWHIDYLLQNNNLEIIEIKVFPSFRREECERNLILQSMPESEIPVNGFGSSDCSKCTSHLIYFKELT